MNQRDALKKIGLLSPCGWGNLGDAAIQEAVIQNIRKYHPQAQIYGFSLNPVDTQWRHGITSYPIRREGKRLAALQRRSKEHVSPRARSSPYTWIKARIQAIPRVFTMLQIIRKKFLRPLVTPWGEIAFIAGSYKVLRGFDLLIVSGGGQLDDYWGGAWAHPYTLCKWAVIARLARTRLVILSVGAHAMRSPLSKFFIKCALRLASYRSYRDERSRSLVGQLGVAGENPVFPDLAYSLEIRNHSSTSEAKSNLVVGVSPMAYFDPRSWPEKDKVVYDLYLRKLAAVVSRLMELGYSVIFFPSEVYMDQLAVDDLREIMHANGTLPSVQEIHRGEILTVDDLLTQIARCDFVIASRLHGVLLASLMRRPVLAISYDAKVDGLMADLAQTGYCVDINRFTPEMIVERLTVLGSNREVVTRRLSDATERFREALDRQYRTVFGCSASNGPALADTIDNKMVESRHDAAG